MVLLLYAGALGCLMGMLAAYLLQVLGAWLQAAWLLAMATAGLLGAVALVLWVAVRTVESGRVPSWADRVLGRVAGQGVRVWAHGRLMALHRYDKGEIGELRVWESVAHAIAAPGCAVAASVTDIPGLGGGDIDLLVATPVCLWVVDAKYRDLPRGEVAGAVRKVADQVAAVEAWAPAGTRVLGCMVLAFAEGDYPKETYDRAGAVPIPEIKVFDRAGKLESALEREVSRPRTLDERVAKAVWALGRGTT